MALKEAAICRLLRACDLAVAVAAIHGNEAEVANYRLLKGDLALIIDQATDSDDYLDWASHAEHRALSNARTAGRLVAA